MFSEGCRVEDITSRYSDLVLIPEKEIYKLKESVVIGCKRNQAIDNEFGECSFNIEYKILKYKSHFGQLKVNSNVNIFLY